MPHMMLRRRIALGSAVFLAAFLLMTSAHAQEPDRTAADVLVDLESHPIPEMDQARTSERAYAVQYRMERERAIRIRAAFVRELHYLEPTHASLPGLFDESWSLLLQSQRIDDILRDIKTIREKGATGQLADKAMYWDAFLRAQEAVRSSRLANAQILGPVRAFVGKYKDDPRSAYLLYAAARRLDSAPSDQEKIYRQLVTDYADTDYAQRATGKLRQIEGLGQPFVLAFTEAVTGDEVSMDQLKGQVVVIDFWATWCGPCVAEMPRMKELYAKYHEKGVEFIGVSLDHPEKDGGLRKLLEYVKTNDIPWPQYYQGNGWRGEFSWSWAIDSIPRVFIVDRQGRLHSANARDQLETLIPELLGIVVTEEIDSGGKGG